MSGIPEYDRLAMNRDTVNPMPPSRDTPKRILLFMRSGILSRPVLMANQVKVNIPINFPNTSAKNTVRVTPSTDARLKPSKEMLALAKAKRGMTM